MNEPTIRRIIALLVVASMLCACAGTTPSQPSPSYGMPLDKLPPVSFFFKHPDAEFQQDCQAYDTRSPLHDCRVNSVDLNKVHAAFDASGIFTSTAYASNEVDYQILLTTAIYDSESGKELGNALLSGATLMLVPLKQTREIIIEALLTWQGVAIKEFHYKIPFETHLSLLNMRNDTDDKLANIIASHLLQDLQEQEAFSTTLLSEKLQSSDYATGLQLPESNHDFFVYDRHTFHHPLLGTQIRFQHRRFFFDYIDVFVYPIKHWRLEDQQENLRKESDNIRREMTQLQTRGAYRNLRLGENSEYQLPLNDESIGVLRFTGSFVNRKGERYESRAYLFSIHDKFVKVRASFRKTSENLPNTDAFVEKLVAHIDVPAESPFMIKVREKWRTSELAHVIDQF